MNQTIHSATGSLAPATGTTSQCGSQVKDAFFEDLVRRNLGRMFATAQRILRDEQESLDAVQDAFVQAFKCYGDFRGQSQVSTWLHRITVNAALMRLRKRRRADRISIESMLPAFDDTGHRLDVRPAWSESPDELLQRKEMRATVRQCIDQLPDDYRTVILLRDIEELNTEETAEILNLTAGAVKTRLHRARMALRSLLEDEFAHLDDNVPQG